jgi:hypothetical protein
MNTVTDDVEPFSGQVGASGDELAAGARPIADRAEEFVPCETEIEKGSGALDVPLDDSALAPLVEIPHEQAARMQL